MAGRPVVQAEGARQGPGCVLAAVLLLLAGCATGTPVGFKLASGDVRHRRMVPTDVRRAEKRPPGTTVDSRKTVVLPELTGELGTGALARYKDFIHGRREALSRQPEEERRLEEAALRELEWWLWQQEEAQLARQHPLEVYLRMLEARQAAEKKEAARWAAVEEKLEEYWRWAESISRNQARQHFRPVGREHLLTESPLWEAAQNDLVSATLKAMLDYIEEYGGHIELWVRSARHSNGPTQMSGPLQKRLARLRRQGRVDVQYSP